MKFELCKPRDLEVKGLVERANGYLETSFLPALAFTSPADFNIQLADWLTKANRRVQRSLQARPADRLQADRSRMLPLPPVSPPSWWKMSLRLPRDHYVRLDTCDYWVHPLAVGRRIEVSADLDQVLAFCDGVEVARHARSWARHQTITDPDHAAATAAARTQTAKRPVPADEPEVEQRSLDTTTASSASSKAGSARKGWPDEQADGQHHRPGQESEPAFFTRAFKAPALRDAAARLAERAKAEGWTHEEYLAACLQREVAARDTHGAEGRIRAARFPSQKSLENFDFDHQRSVKREMIAHLGTLDFVAAQENVIFLGPPGTGKTHLACQAGHRVAFATAAQWVARLAEAHEAGKLTDELTRLARISLIVVDEVGYIPFEPEAANLFFQFISGRYERTSVIVTSNKPFGRWGEVFGDDTVAAAMIDRLVQHAEVISLKGDSNRMRGRDLGRVPAANTGE